MNERYIKWYTPYLSREFEMLAFGNGGGLPLILFPTSFGSYYQNKDFGLVGSVSGYVDAGQVTVYCPDAIDLESFYKKSIHPADRMRTHNAYENVIVRDVFDLARTNAIVIAWRSAAQALGPITRPISPFVIPIP
jgi:esterase/lipase superfamily enzyme